MSQQELDKREKKDRLKKHGLMTAVKRSGKFEMERKRRKKKKHPTCHP